ncbi:transposase IS3/IS911 family protein [Shinella sp. DD12]|nr:transposase IS3/IS911 family protein [Shinella sp. DD12]
MSNEYRHVELLTGDVRRRRWTTEQKLTIIEQSFEPGETVSSTARRHRVAPNLVYRWRRLLSEGGAAAVDSDEPVVGNSEVKKLEDRVRELERMLGRKTMEVEILREALSKADSKKRISRPILTSTTGPREVDQKKNQKGCSGKHASLWTPPHARERAARTRDVKDTKAREPRSRGCSVVVLYNEIHPHSALKMASPRQFIRARSN